MHQTLVGHTLDIGATFDYQVTLTLALTLKIGQGGS